MDAVFHSLTRLSTAYYIEGNTGFRSLIEEFVGPRLMATLDSRFLRSQREGLSLPTPGEIRETMRTLAPDLALGRQDVALEPEPEPGGPRLEPKRPRRFWKRFRTLKSRTQVSRGQAFITAGPQPQVPEPESRLDLTTLVTTVDIPSRSNMSFAQLVEFLDPRSWSRSPFWPESYEVTLDKDTHEFTKVPGTPKLGLPTTGWSGFLFEHVEWNWNLSTVSSFKNYLRIDYKVDEQAQTIELDFDLYLCDGSQLYALVLRRGIDIDFGFQRVRANPSGSGWVLNTQKNLRFSDTLDRRTPFEGPIGSGQLLIYMAPAIVGLWMNDLLSRLNV